MNESRGKGHHLRRPCATKAKNAEDEEIVPMVESI
jgi:hypothetical protein